MSAQAFAMAAGDDVVIAGDGPDLDGMGIVDDWFLNESRAAVVITDHLGDIFHDQPLLLADQRNGRRQGPVAAFGLGSFLLVPAGAAPGGRLGRQSQQAHSREGRRRDAIAAPFLREVDRGQGGLQPSMDRRGKIAAGKFRTMLLEGCDIRTRASCDPECGSPAV